MTALRAIHAGLRAIGIKADDDRRDLYARVTGKRSLREMTAAEQSAVVEELRRLGFRPAAAGNAPKKAARADVRYIHVLWRLLSEQGAVTSPGRKELNSFVRSRFGRAWGAELIDVDALTEWRQINDVVTALQEWCDREGIPCRRARKGAKDRP